MCSDKFQNVYKNMTLVDEKRKIVLLLMIVIIVYLYVRPSNVKHSKAITRQWLSNDTHAIIQTVIYYNASKL